VYDIAIVGGGPAGATCAALCAAGGRRVLLLERSRFPREKVCGDCLNPLAWPVLEQLGLEKRILSCPHTVLEGVRFIALDGTSVRVPFPQSALPELGLTRSILDNLILARAREAGTDVFEDTPLKKVSRTPRGWRLECDAGVFEAEQLVAADGRNSTVARQLGILPAPLSDERVAVQTHIAALPEIGSEVCLQFVREGYAGIAPVGDNRANLCLVSRPRDLGSLKAWAHSCFNLPPNQIWRSITPLRRAPLAPVWEGLWLTGDAARVVEPFTGEGIAYALRSGASCAEALLHKQPERYSRAHAKLYKGRLWINHLARWACLHPRGGSAIVHLGRIFPSSLGLLTRKVVSQ